MTEPDDIPCQPEPTPLHEPEVNENAEEKEWYNQWHMYFKFIYKLF